MTDGKDKEQELEPILVLALWMLLFTGDEPKLSEMKPQLSPKRRKILEDLGLIEMEKRTTPSKSGRNVSATHIVLTDKAWQWASENLDAEFSKTINGSRALAGLLPRLKGYIEHSGTSLAELLAPSPALRVEEEPASPLLQSADVEGRIRQAYHTVSGGEWNVRVRLADLRKELSRIPRETLDEALLRMQREGKLVLYPNNNPRELTEADHHAALDILGAKRHLLYMRG